MSKIRLILVMWLSLLIGITFSSCEKDDNQITSKSKMTDITDFSYSNNACGSESAFTSMYQEPDEQMKQKHQFVSLYDGTKQSMWIFESMDNSGNIIQLAMDRSYGYQLSGWLRYKDYNTYIKCLIYDTKCGSFLFVYDANNVAGYPNPDKNKFIIAYRLIYRDDVLSLYPYIKGQTYVNQLNGKNAGVDIFYTEMFQTPNP